MNKKYIIMVINDMFEDENLLIVKSIGSQMVRRYDGTITSKDLQEYLESNGIDVNSCTINVVEEDWRGNPTITRW